MKLMIKILLSLGLLTLSSTTLYAANVSAGEKKSSFCAGCHGTKGITKNAQFPNLAGQKATYIAAQLRAFKKDTRLNPMMQHIAKQLSAEDINNLATYFSKIKNNSTHPSKIKIAKETASKASMCKGCHGSNAEGRGGFPRLTNQHVQYLEKQLKAFKSGNRKSSPMSSIAKSLSDEDIEQLSAYMSGLKAENK